MKLRVEEQPLELEAQEPPASARPVALLPVLYELADAIIDAVARRSAGEGRPVRCGAGCAACCRQLVPVGPAEAERLRAVVDAMSEPRRSQVRARFEEAVAKVNAAGAGRAGDSALRSATLEKRTEPLEWVQLSLEYFRAQVACPFLVDERCSIYADRPIACREHLVTSAPSRCAELKMNRVQNVGLTGRFFAALEAVDHAPGRHFEWVALPYALSWKPTRKVKASAGALARMLEAMPVEVIAVPAGEG